LVPWIPEGLHALAIEAQREQSPRPGRASRAAQSTTRRFWSPPLLSAIPEPTLRRLREAAASNLPGKKNEELYRRLGRDPLSPPLGGTFELHPPMIATSMRSPGYGNIGLLEGSHLPSSARTFSGVDLYPLSSIRLHFLAFLIKNHLFVDA